MGDVGDGIQTVQIKGRWQRAGDNRARVSSINAEKPLDFVILVLLMGDSYNVHEIREADRASVIERRGKPGSRARKERRSMGVGQSKTSATRVWPDRQ